MQFCGLLEMKIPECVDKPFDDRVDIIAMELEENLTHLHKAIPISYYVIIQIHQIFGFILK